MLQLTILRFDGLNNQQQQQAYEVSIAPLFSNCCFCLIRTVGTYSGVHSILQTFAFFVVGYSLRGMTDEKCS
jgi:hypothetical protein